MFLTTSQRRGFIFFLFLFSVYISIHFYINFSIDELNEIKVVEKHFINHSNKNKIKKKEIVPAVKNPNLWSKEDWINLGFSKKQTSTILSYKNKISGFKNKKQLYSCYVINQQSQNKLDTLVEFPKQIVADDNLIDVFLLKKSIKPCYDLIDNFDTIYYEKRNREYFYYLLNKPLNLKLYCKNEPTACSDIDILSKKKEDLKIIYKKYAFINRKFSININKADTNEWTNLKGIGLKTANQILSFRKSLGGFSNVNQLREVYLISDSLYYSVKDQLFSDEKVQKININEISVNSLKSHPYINWNLANAIVNFRIQHGQYLSVEKIKEIHLVNDEIYLKIAPYFKI